MMFATLRNRLHESFVRWAMRVRPPEPAPIVLSQRRVYVLPTPAGVAYTMALGVILLGAMNYNLSLGHALVFLLAGLGIVAILHTFRNLVQLSLRPGRCESVFAGEQARFDLIVENLRPDARPSLRIFFEDGQPLEIDVGPSASAIASLGLHTARRGWLPMPRVTIETTWPLGLVRARLAGWPDARSLDGGGQHLSQFRAGTSVPVYRGGGHQRSDRPDPVQARSRPQRGVGTGPRIPALGRRSTTG